MSNISKSHQNCTNPLGECNLEILKYMYYDQYLPLIKKKNSERVIENNVETNQRQVWQSDRFES